MCLVKTLRQRPRIPELEWALESTFSNSQPSIPEVPSTLNVSPPLTLDSPSHEQAQSLSGNRAVILSTVPQCWPRITVSTTCSSGKEFCIQISLCSVLSSNRFLSLEISVMSIIISKALRIPAVEKNEKIHLCGPQSSCQSHSTNNNNSSKTHRQPLKSCVFPLWNHLEDFF